MQFNSEHFQRLFRRLALIPRPRDAIKAALLRARGAKIGKGTVVPYEATCTWPHQISLGENCIIRPRVFFNYDHYWTPGPSMVFGNRVFVGRDTEFNIRCRLQVGDDCLIASGCTFIDSDHGTEPDVPMNQQMAVESPITLEDNVWIGAQSVILKGVHIGRGSVVGAGSVVTKSIPAGEKWAGVPAKPIHQRSSQRHCMTTS
ncbi:MAG: acyltransferase [Rhodopirellula sp. JB053]